MDNHLFYKISNTIYQGLLCNCCFALSNLPIFLYILFFSHSNNIIIGMFLIGITLLPSLSSLLFCIHIISENNGVRIFSTYFSNFKKSFFKILPFSIIFSVVSLTFIYFFRFRTSLPPFIVLLFTFSSSLFTPILLNFSYYTSLNLEKTSKSIFLFAVYISIRKWYLSIINLLAYLLLLLACLFNPILGFLIVPIFIGSGIYISCQSLSKNITN